MMFRMMFRMAGLVGYTRPDVIRERELEEAFSST
jgi:hypothetical protein